MNKTSKKRAFFVVLAICLAYISVAFQATDLFSMKRALPDHVSQTSPMNIYAGNLQRAETRGNEAQKTAEEVDRTPETVSSSVKTEETPPTYTPVLSDQPTGALAKEAPKSADDKSRHGVTTPHAVKDRLSIEPSVLIALPVVCQALKEGRIDKEGLIFWKKDGYNSGSWKKPADILKDHDEEGIKVLLRSVGKDFFLEILRKEGIQTRPDLSPEELMTGKGYTVEKKKLLSLYHRHVADGYNELFPFMLPTIGVIKTKAGFELVESARSLKPARKAEEEWLMPNLANLPLRLAIERLAVHTSHIKVYGSGVVVEQSPRPFERLRGESEVSLQGRLYSQ
ncbi:MAG TPA: hypothetical protein DCR97_02875 [Deltaproteobacteria bacterium]|nr:hypothetical protein [Deltaproteobacteria bacterium]